MALCSNSHLAFQHLGFPRRLLHDGLACKSAMRACCLQLPSSLQRFLVWRLIAVVSQYKYCILAHLCPLPWLCPLCLWWVCWGYLHCVLSHVPCGSLIALISPHPHRGKRKELASSHRSACQGDDLAVPWLYGNTQLKRDELQV